MDNNKQKECNMDTRAIHLWLRCWQHGLTALALLLALCAPALAATAESPFELDANPQDDNPALNSDDWATPPDSGAATKFTGIIQDTAPRTIFEGGNKDILDIDKWSWKDGSVPDKDDLTHAYAAAYNEDNDLLLYFGADRISNVGDAFMGFWFFKQKVTALPNGGFSGKHTVGDTLVLINFPQASNAVPYLAVVTWDPTCSKATNNNPQPGQCAAANLRLKLQGSGANDVVCANQGGANLACALTNTGNVPVPANTLANGVSGLWSDYTPKSGTQGTFPFESFFEGGINLSQIVGGSDGCFSSFMAETRSSSSFTAALKDFVLDNFELCKVEITKVCTGGDINGDDTGFTYSFEGTVTNAGFGTIYDVVVTDDNGTPADTSDDFVVATFDSIAKGGSEDYSGSFGSAGNGPTNGVSVKAASSDGGTLSITASAAATCPVVQREPGISVTKACSTKVIDAGSQLVLRVDYSGEVCNTTGVGDPNSPDYKPPLNLSGVTVTDDPSGNVHNIGTLNAADCKDYSGSYTPSSAGSEEPGAISFSDTVTATGTAPLGFGSDTDTATATCPLCPTCPDCPTP